jgi:hypothetical protein
MALRSSGPFGSDAIVVAGEMPVALSSLDTAFES